MQTYYLLGVLLLIVSIGSSDAQFRITHAVSKEAFDDRSNARYYRKSNARLGAKDTNGTPALRSERGITGKVMIVVLAVDGTRAIHPELTYEGVSGGDGCSFLERLFNSPGCETTSVSGPAEPTPFKAKQPKNVRYFTYRIPVGTHTLHLKVPPKDGCGRSHGNCHSSSHHFELKSFIDDPAKPGCMKLLYDKNHTWRYCRSTLFIKHGCRNRCRWDKCSPTNFAMRIYPSFNDDEFKLPQFKGDRISTCDSHTLTGLFVAV